MTDIRRLIHHLASIEAELRASEFLAPCVKGGKVRTRIGGMVYTFAAEPRDFEGWGIFQPLDERRARLVETAELPQIDAYLQRFPKVRLRLAYRLQNRSWLAYPVNEADTRQRLKSVKPMAVHLVSDGVTFDEIVARWNGVSCWFEDIDRRSDPVLRENLQSALKKFTQPEELRFKGMTPEMRTVYGIVARRTEGFDSTAKDEQRLRKALELGGGQLRGFKDNGDYWNVDWMTADGYYHTSAIAKGDLTVLSSGICLSGRDRDFDLQSLVGVMEDRD